MREQLFVIACATLSLDIRLLFEEMGLEAETRFLPGGLHEDPNRLRREVQAAIDEVAGQPLDRIVVGYGLCGRGTVGLAARDIPLAIPRVHDCISLFLGGNDAYRREFDKCPGTYYISAGWYEEKTAPLRQKGSSVYLEGEQFSFDELVARYGLKKAEKTFKFLNSWQCNYRRAAFIDTGADGGELYADYARQLARQHGWTYEALPGDLGLLRRLLTTRATTDEILIVPPHHFTLFEGGEARLNSGSPVAPPEHIQNYRTSAADREPSPTERLGARIGLGIDAGGTYTDAVVYDLVNRQVLGKNKALTTKWNFAEGIAAALAGLDQALLGRVELTAVSTTLATNAMVEGDGQKVGLFLMPPFGLFEKGDIPHEPKAVIAGRLDIAGIVTEGIDEAAIRRTAREMVDTMGVEAFAVSGFAGSVNPEHELAVRRILREETDLFVSCGHELSDLLNFRTRAETAVQNARIVPRLVRLLNDLEKVLTGLCIPGRIVVVKGDGSLMSGSSAAHRPVETILSGPAASVAGARFLSDRQDAIVVDMGGTTTDTAALEGGQVKVAMRGSRVGTVRTHVKALEIRTAGLGGDSLITFENGRFAIGPRRVAPMAWLGTQEPGPDIALTLAEGRLPRARGLSSDFRFFSLAGHHPAFRPTEAEAVILETLGERPRAVFELAEALGLVHPSLVPLTRLQENHVIQAYGLTPTDLLHATGDFTRWHIPTARRAVAYFATLASQGEEEMVAALIEEVSRRLAVELIKKQLGEDVESDGMDECSVCQALTANILAGGNRNYRVGFRLERPVIGIGAPIGYFLPRAAKLLETEAILPQHADVANAIGAITSRIVVRRRVKIHPAERGGFSLEGLPGATHFPTLTKAEAFAREALRDLVLRLAREAGTGETRVLIDSEDRNVQLSGGDKIFLERILTASLTGHPDLLPQEKAVRTKPTP